MAVMTATDDWANEALHDVLFSALCEAEGDVRRAGLALDVTREWASSEYALDIPSSLWIDAEDAILRLIDWVNADLKGRARGQTARTENAAELAAEYGRLA
jgi:hypothetical protein